MSEAEGRASCSGGRIAPGAGRRLCRGAWGWQQAGDCVGVPGAGSRQETVSGCLGVAALSKGLARPTPASVLETRPWATVTGSRRRKVWKLLPAKRSLWGSWVERVQPASQDLGRCAPWCGVWLGIYLVSWHSKSPRVLIWFWVGDA